MSVLQTTLSEGRRPAPRAFLARRHSVLPGFSLALGYSVFYLALFVLIPLAAVFAEALKKGWASCWRPSS